MTAPALDPVTLKTMSSQDLMRLEGEIARRFSGMVPWGSVAWGLCNLVVWLSLWPLVLFGHMPLWAAFPIATLNVMLSYLPSHEAQHDIIGRPGEPLRWLNELVGHVSTLPLVLPYRMLKLTHLEHHKHTNHSELDPDIHTRAPTAWAFFVNSLRNRQPGGQAQTSYAATLQRLGTPQAGLAMLEALGLQLTYLAVLFACALTGHALEAALIWWLPRHIASTYIGFYLSWAPHHPALETGRYRNTRGFRSLVGNIGSMGMQFHVIHHLHPRIPLMKTPAAFYALRPVLEARNCPIEGL